MFGFLPRPNLHDDFCELRCTGLSAGYGQVTVTTVSDETSSNLFKPVPISEPILIHKFPLSSLLRTGEQSMIKRIKKWAFDKKIVGIKHNQCALHISQTQCSVQNTEAVRRQHPVFGTFSFIGILTMIDIILTFWKYILTMINQSSKLVNYRERKTLK